MHPNYWPNYWPKYWLERWQNGQIGFHEGAPNALLVRHFQALGLARDSRVFVPLCGKSHDLVWLLSQNYRVVGSELSKMAVEEFFAEHGLSPTIEKRGRLDLYRVDKIDIFVGDIFDLTKDQLGPIDGLYDRGALVALPADLRTSYARQLLEIGGHKPQLLLVYDYDQALRDGPPFAISETEIAHHYGQVYALELLETITADERLKVKGAVEIAWFLEQISLK